MNVAQIVTSYFKFIEKDVFKAGFLIILISLSTLLSLVMLVKFEMSVYFYLFLCTSYIYLMFILIKRLNLANEKLKSFDAKEIESKIINYTHLLDEKIVEAYQVESIKRTDCEDIELIVAEDFDVSNFVTQAGSYIRPSKSVYYLKKRLRVHYFITPVAYIVLGSMNLIFNVFSISYFLAYLLG